MKFKEGDRAQRICGDHGYTCGKIYTVLDNGAVKDDDGDRRPFFESYYRKIGEAMSLRERIEALNNGWDKEADDILEELDKAIGKRWCYRLSIPIWNLKYNQGIEVSETGKTVRSFRFISQCEKNQAFKDALLWLLDKSGLEESVVGKMYYDPQYGKIFEVRSVKKKIIECGNRCEFYSDAHTSSSANWKTNVSYLEKCREIVDVEESGDVYYYGDIGYRAVKKHEKGDTIKIESEGKTYKVKVLEEL